MRVVVVGDGKVGYILAKQLAQEGHEIVVIDRNASVLHGLQEKLDVAVVVGNGAAANVQEEAGVGESDLLIAATSSDEVNLLCSLVAHALGCPRIIARVRNPEYDGQIGLLRTTLGLAFTINPEKSAAHEIFRLLQFPSFLKRASFVGGRAEMVEIKLADTSCFAGKPLRDVGEKLRGNALVCAVERDSECIVPAGDFVMQAGDHLSILAATADLPALIAQFGIRTQRIRRVMLVGGGTIATYLARELILAKVDVTIIEQSRERCHALFAQLPEATVLHGDGTAKELLLTEGIREMDAVVTLTGMDEENLLVSLFANHIGVPKTITKINRLEFAALLSDIGLDTLVSPKQLVASEIVRYVRAVGQSREGSVETLHPVGDGTVEVLGFKAPGEGAFLNVPLTDLQLKPQVLIGCLVRNRQVIIPQGTDSIHPGDGIVVVADAALTVANLIDIFASSEPK